MSEIVWLASYVKSGNTWFRAFLTNLMRPEGAPASINSLLGGPIASARPPFEDALGYSITDLTQEEIDDLRPEVTRYYAQEIREEQAPRFRKIHDAYNLLPDGRPQFPPDATKGVIYLVRNPLDVCVSMAGQGINLELEEIIQRMGNARLNPPQNTFVAPQIYQRLLSWSEHVRSWMEAPGLRLHLIRYEDMILKPEETFRMAAQFLELPSDMASVQQAIKASRFEELLRQENEVGFNEKRPRSPRFFNRGKIGTWREYLSSEQAGRVIADHEEMMRRLGYLDEQGQLTC